MWGGLSRKWAGGPDLLHALSEDGAVVATMMLAAVEVAASAAGGMGWEDIGFLAAGVLNSAMSSFLIVSFFSFSGSGIWVSSLWLDVNLGFGLGVN